MIITIKDKKLKAALEDQGTCRRLYGAEMAKKLKLRMAALHAAQSLADLWPPMSPPERCHLLTEDLAGIFSIDVKHPYRLLFVPTDAPDHNMDEKQRWQTIKAIEILRIRDTHE